jgi:hypothetical protein
MKLIKRKITIRDLTFVDNGISDKTESILSKDISELTLQEISHLLRESIATQTCINISVERLSNVKLNTVFFYNSSQSEAFRELLRELVLLHELNWDINIKAYEKILGKIGNYYFDLNLPTYIQNKFKYYKPKKLEWNKNSVDSFNSWMNDNRAGVVTAYDLVHSLKKAVLNGTKIYYNLNNEEKIITCIQDFENLILTSIKCNQELTAMLDAEKN